MKKHTNTDKICYKCRNPITEHGSICICCNKAACPTHTIKSNDNSGWFEDASYNSVCPSCWTASMFNEEEYIQIDNQMLNDIKQEVEKAYPSYICFLSWIPLYIIPLLFTLILIAYCS